MTQELKYDLALPGTELAALLRALADTLEGGPTPEPYQAMLPEGLSRVRLDIKPQPGDRGCRVKLKIEARTEGQDEDHNDEDAAAPRLDAAGRPKYKSLKKKMKADFKTIHAALALGALPDPAVVDAFLADAETMCTYPDKGDSHYPEFLEAVAALRAAWQERDPAALRAAADELAQCKRRCHDIYK